MTRIFPTIAHAVAGTAPVARPPLTPNPTDHLLSRFAFGPTPSARADVAAKGPQGWFTDQVAVGKAGLGYGGHLAVAAQGPAWR